MDQSAEIGSAGVTMTFACARRLPGGAAELLDVKLRDQGLQAETSVYEAPIEGFESLARYFDDLERCWRGWDGERVYESLESDLRIAATHDGHVRLNVRLWRYSVDLDRWFVETVVVIDAGEELSRAAKDISSVVRS